MWFTETRQFKADRSPLEAAQYCRQHNSLIAWGNQTQYTPSLDLDPREADPEETLS
ncbi:uncharacterized protein BO95DRAFT_448366, partial [Aspergillus brunneoviolaceus CBS 621.78]